MSAADLRKAAETLRQRAETEAILRDGDPYYTTEATAWEGLMHPGVGLALADWLDQSARYATSREENGVPVDESCDPRPLRVARLINGGAS